MPNRQSSITRARWCCGAAHVEAGIVGVVRIAGAGQVQAAQHGVVGLQQNTVPLPPASMTTCRRRR
jgi:hypothetical protein